MLLGTLYPLFLDLLTGNKVSVGPPFFNATFVPICAPLFAALCVGPFLGWKRAELWPALVHLRTAFIVAVIAAIVAAYAVDGRATLAAVAFGFGVWLIVGSLAEFASRLKLGRAPLRRLAAPPARHAALLARHDDRAHRAGLRRAGRGRDRRLASRADPHREARRDGALRGL